MALLFGIKATAFTAAFVVQCSRRPGELRTTILAATSPAKQLNSLLEAELNGTRESDSPILLPCCYDGLTARLIAAAGFEATFMTGFGVSAVNGYPDTQLVSFAEMQRACATVAEALGSSALELGCDPLVCIAVRKTIIGPMSSDSQRVV